MKDRMALAMIEAAQADGRLRPGGSVVEYTGVGTGGSLRGIGARLRARSRTVVTVAVDSGMKYLSTPLYAGA